jgi:hypothetical protein
MSNNVGVGTIEKFDPENTGVAAGILFLSALELEKHLGGNSTPWTTNGSILYWTLGELNMQVFVFNLLHSISAF